MKFPSGFIDSIKSACCFDEYSFTNAHETDSNITSVRINPFKYTHQFDSNEKVKWCESGRYLEQRPVFTNDPLLHAGSYYVQEASSMFIAHLVKNTVRLSEPIKALDLCAAPGGKTTLLASLISSNSILVANEAIKSRSNILAENIILTLKEVLGATKFYSKLQLL